MAWAQSDDTSGARDADETDQLDARFCIRDQDERAEQMSRVAPTRDGLLSRIDQQLGSLT